MHFLFIHFLQGIFSYNNYDNNIILIDEIIVRCLIIVVISSSIVLLLLLCYHSTIISGIIVVASYYYPLLLNLPTGRIPHAAIPIIWWSKHAASVLILPLFTPGVVYLLCTLFNTSFALFWNRMHSNYTGQLKSTPKLGLNGCQLGLSEVKTTPAGKKHSFTPVSLFTPFYPC
jgi:hypothetical protein